MRGGSVQGGLKLYVGAGNMVDDGGYTAKVMAEYNRLQGVINGRRIPYNAPRLIPVSQPPQPQALETVASLVSS
jgi:hypothetical protein